MSQYLAIRLDKLRAEVWELGNFWAVWHDLGAKSF